MSHMPFIAIASDAHEGRLDFSKIRSDFVTSVYSLAADKTKVEGLDPSTPNGRSRLDSLIKGFGLSALGQLMLLIPTHEVGSAQTFFDGVFEGASRAFQGATEAFGHFDLANPKIRTEIAAFASVWAYHAMNLADGNLAYSPPTMEQIEESVGEIESVLRARPWAKTLGDAVSDFSHQVSSATEISRRKSAVDLFLRANNLSLDAPFMDLATLPISAGRKFDELSVLVGSGWGQADKIARDSSAKNLSRLLKSEPKPAWFKPLRAQGRAERIAKAKAFVGWARTLLIPIRQVSWPAIKIEDQDARRTGSPNSI